MNLGPFKDRTRKKGSFIKAVGKQGICAIAFLALAVGGIVLAVSLGGKTGQQAQADPTAKPPQAEVTRRPNDSKDVTAPGLVTVPEKMLLPVKGEMRKEFAQDSLVFSQTMKEWSTHNGVDISCAQGDKVAAVLSGTVERAQADYLLGNVVVIKHSNGLKTVYAGLDAIADDIKAGTKVVAGKEIGTAGNTALNEIADGVHLHFEVLKDGKNVDPMEYLDDAIK